MIKLTAGLSILSTIIAGTLWGITGFIATAALITFAGIWFTYKKSAKITVGEMEVAVVYKNDGKNFARFLPAGTHWINPIEEQISEVITTAGQSVRGQSKQAQTIGGLPIQVNWVAQFALTPLKIEKAVAPKMARALPSKAAAIAKQHVDNITHHVIGEHTMEQLCQPGIQQKLERRIRQLAKTRLESLGFNISRIMIEAIHMPKHVVKALEAAHERELQAEQEARALERLHRVVSRFSDEEMQRLMELERIHTLGRNGVTMVYPTNGVNKSRPTNPIILDGAYA